MQHRVSHWNDLSNLVFKGDGADTPCIVVILWLGVEAEPFAEIEKYSIEDGLLCFEYDADLTPSYEYVVFLVSKGSGGGVWAAAHLNKTAAAEWVAPKLLSVDSNCGAEKK